MKRLFFISLVLILSFSISANVISQTSKKELQKEHIAKIREYGHQEVLRGEHSFLFLFESSKIKGGTSQNRVLYSVYITKASFSCYSKEEKKNMYLYNKLHTVGRKMAIMNTINKITHGKKTVSVDYKAILPSLTPKSYGLTLHVRTDFTRTRSIVNCVLGHSSEIYNSTLPYIKGNARYIIVALTKIAKELSYIIVARKLTTTRKLKIKNFTWNVSSGQVLQYGDGNVIKFFLWIKGGAGSIRHEILAGHLVITGIWGKMNGTGVIYMTQ